VKIIIVDDEELARARLLRMLTTLGYSEITEVTNADEALEAIQKESFDLAFLDINMPKISGLELGYELRCIDERLQIIFQTAYEEHALKAFDIGALGYLVKPYSIDQLKTLMQRVTSAQTQQTKDLRILSKNGDNYLLLKPEEIFYVKADLSEVMLRTAKGFSYLSQKISDLERKLSGHNFIKIHRSYLININEIKEIETIEQSKLRFSFKNCSDDIESSKDGAKAFREKFTNNC